MNYKIYTERLSEKSKHLENGCIEWIGPVKGIGYGFLTIGSRTDKSRITITAHRLSYLIHKGDTNNLCILHKCDNPRCINPNHLFLGTRAENNHDRESKNRGFYPIGTDHPRALLTEKTVRAIREKYATGKYTHRQLAKLYGFKNHSSVGDAVRQKTYFPKPPSI